MNTTPTKPPKQQIEIPDAPPRKSWIGRLGFAVLLLAVAGLFVLLFVQFTASWRLALILVLFLGSYMLLMGYWASRNIEGRDER